MVYDDAIKQVRAFAYLVKQPPFSSGTSKSVIALQNSLKADIETTKAKRSDREGPFTIAANALYLNRSHFLIYRQTLPEDLREIYHDDDRRDYSSFCLFREKLQHLEIIDTRIEPLFELNKPFPGQDNRLKKLIQSNADIAQVALRDIPLTEGEASKLIRATGELTRVDIRRPICQWPLGPFTITLREIILEYFESFDINLCYNASLQSTPPDRFSEHSAKGQMNEEVCQSDNALLLSWQDHVSSLEEWSKVHINTQYVREVVTRTMNGEYSSALSAAQAIVADKGHCPKGQKNSKGTVAGTSIDAAVESIYRRARIILKSLEDNGYLPNFPQ